jgi:predicted enzyme related to lactoylglutathione lyase
MPGNFIWYELLTSDAAAAKKFYSHVVGWEIQDAGHVNNDYHMWTMNGSGIGGLMTIPANAVEMGMKPAWLGYIHVANVDTASQAIIAAGGAVHMTMDVPNVGRIAMANDPQGAMFYIMTPLGEGESTAYWEGKPGHCSWNELHTKDGAAAVDFYTRHFGWTKTDELDIGPMGKYHLFNAGSGAPVGGMRSNPDFPRPAWQYYFCVDDINTAKARVEAAGGTICFGPHEVPGGGWIINGQDPQGAAFSLVGPKV